MAHAAIEFTGERSGGPGGVDLSIQVQAVSRVWTVGPNCTTNARSASFDDRHRTDPSRTNS
jgi:hypothetical protein